MGSPAGGGAGVPGQERHGGGAQIPILKHGPCVVVYLQDSVSDTDLSSLWGRLAEQVGTERVRGVVIDVSALDVIDSFACRMLTSIAQALRLRGAEAVIVGIQPDVAFAMVQLGLTVRDVRTMLDAEEALAYLSRAARGHQREERV